MPAFLTGKPLSDQVYKIIWEAERELIIASPYIKLDDHFKKLFEKHKYNHKLHIIIIIGRNESSPGKSLRKEDFAFFKEFKNISIIYCAPMHAKYYANESDGLITSINLHDTCFESNIEYGVNFSVNLLSGIIGSAESDAYYHTKDLIEKHPAVFIKRPVYEKGLLTKNYIESSTLYDVTEALTYINKWNKEEKRFINEFKVELLANGKLSMPAREKKADNLTSKLALSIKKQSIQDMQGYCIRTGNPIPYDINRPMSLEAYQSWKQYKNPDYKENYCHKTGKTSNGKTSMRNPVL